MKTFLRALVLVCLLVCPAMAEPGNERIKIVLVGDSTVTDNAGWGLGFAQFLTGDVECLNTARGGRSSMSFRKEGHWKKALALKGDYYLIQFGHNNEPGKPGRSTDMPTFVSDMTTYVDEVRAAGATPVLVTSLTRRQWDPEQPGKIKSSLEVYAQEVRKIAAEKQVPLIDLHARSIELCESLGQEGCLVFSPIKKTESGKRSYDGTHLNRKGYVRFGQLVAQELKKNVSALAPYLRDTPANPEPVANEAKFDAVVSADGSGTHTTIQAAIAAAPEGATKPFRILIKPGKYQGRFIIPKNKPRIHFIGEEAENTVLTYARNVKEPETEGETQYVGMCTVIEGDDFLADKITFENTSGDHGQALALRVDSDRAVFTNCRLLGWQDTLMVNNGRQYFKDCHIEGRVDFIYGSGTAVFDRCGIHSKNGGYVTAASTPPEKPYGFVFFDCKLTGDTTPWQSPDNNPPAKKSKKPNTFLGRPWRPYGSVTFIRCDLGDHIKPEGWHNWGKVENEATARYVEAQCTGPGANTEGRVKWSKQLPPEDAARLTPATILSGADHWLPTSAR